VWEPVPEPKARQATWSKRRSLVTNSRGTGTPGTCNLAFEKLPGYDFEFDLIINV